MSKSAKKGNKANISSLLKADPGLPHPNPATPYWLREPHPLSTSQSPSLPSIQDVIIIGSGITAASVSRTLLELDSKCTITILEARTICSGATGRNGGHLVTYGGAAYSELKESFGRDMATKIVDFTFKNVERTRELVKQYQGIEEFREVTRLRSFGDRATFEEAKKSIAEFEADNPSMAGMYRFVEKDEAARVHGVHNVEGLVIQKARAL